MKNYLSRILTLMVLVALVAGFSAQEARGQFGVLAGGNFDQLGDIEVSEGTAAFDNATGFHAGIFYDLRFGPVSFRPAAVYVDVGSFTTGGDLTEQEFDMQLVEFPLDLRYRLGTPLVSPYLLAGPILRFANTDEDDFEDAINNFSVAGGVGAGIELAVPGTGVRLYPELRYQFGMTRIVDEFEVGGIEFTSDEGGDLSTIMLRLGITL